MIHVDLVPGIYCIRNSKVPNAIDMLGGDPHDGARIGSWKKLQAPTDVSFYNQLWFIEPLPTNTTVKSKETKYTLRNVRTGTYMDLENASSEDGITLVGRKKGSITQHWFFRPVSDNRMRICNSVTNTFVDLYSGDTSMAARIVGHQLVDGPSIENQLWEFEKISRLGCEIHAMLTASPSIGVEFRSYHPNGVYLILPFVELAASIWKNNDLERMTTGREIFDCDSFAFAFKAAVAKWGYDMLRADGFGILCGIMFGTNANGSRALNWTFLNHEEPPSLLFFDPQDGSMVTDSPWDYKPSFGIF